METRTSSSTTSPTSCRRPDRRPRATARPIRRWLIVACAAAWFNVFQPGTPDRAVVAVSAQTAAQQAAQAAAGLPNEDGSVKFAVLGDTGTGGGAQYDVAERLVEVRQHFPFEFVLMLGDNLYGRENPSDYVSKFERPYRPLLRAGVRFYATLGNHDEPSQRFYEPFNMQGRRYYQFTKGDVEFYALDSTYMTPAQVNWLRQALEKSDAQWKIAFFHHPLYSSGEKHGSEEDLRVLLEPLFVEHGVDVVFAGHEHFYERLVPQRGIHYFTAGGSAKLRRGNLDDRSPLTAKGFDTDNSFMLVEIAGDDLVFETISRRAQVVDAGTIKRREVASTN